MLLLAQRPDRLHQATTNKTRKSKKITRIKQRRHLVTDSKRRSACGSFSAGGLKAAAAAEAETRSELGASDASPPERLIGR